MKKFFFYIFFYISLLFASESIFDQKYKFFLGYQYAQYNVLLQSTDKEEVLVDINGKTYSYFDKIYREYRIKSFSNNVLCSFEIKPFNKIWYSIDVQLVPSQNVELSYTQKLCSTKYGWCGGVGLNYMLFPQTIVSDGINISGKIFFENYKFDFFIDENDKYKIDTELSITDILTRISFSKIFYKLFEINYGGEILYRSSSLIDKKNYFIVSGKETLVQIFLTSRIYLTKNESLNFNILKSINDNVWIVSSGIIIGW